MGRRLLALAAVALLACSLARSPVVEPRWTPVWQKTGARWLLVHEHLSAPAEPRPRSDSGAASHP
jgi:ketosteroid isomerase-like protein